MTKRIVILGGGFAGVRCALDLAKKVNQNTEIVLINKRPHHVYRPDLYEVATAFTKEISEVCMLRLSDTVALSLHKIFEQKPVRVIIDEVIGIDPKGKKVMLKENKSTRYDYLVVALGSVINDFGIPGLKENAYTLKTTNDAIKMNCTLDKLFFNRWRENDVRPISLVIGGGGATGVELACELKGYSEMLAKKYRFPLDHVAIKVIEGGSKLAQQDEFATEKILKRFRELGITVELKAKITNVSASSVTVKTDASEFTLNHDLFMWTGGVKPTELIKSTFINTSTRGGVVVNEFLQTTEDVHVFACGDNAAITDSKTGQPVPWLAQCAVQEGTAVAENILQLLNNKPMKPYKMDFKGVVIPLGKKNGIYAHNGKLHMGRHVWWLRRLIDLKYSASVLPFWYALKKWFAANEVFAQND